MQPAAKRVEPPDLSAFHDWSGTAVMLEDIAHGATFEQLAGLDPARWAVVAVDLKTGTIPGARTGLVVYAVDLAAFGVTGVQDRRRALAEAAGRQELPVTRFVREDLGLADMLAQMKTAHVHFRAALYRDAELCVETPTTETPDDVPGS